MTTQGSTAPNITARPTLTLTVPLMRRHSIKGVSGRPVEVVTVRAAKPAKTSPPINAATPAVKPVAPAKVQIRKPSQAAIANRERYGRTLPELVRRFPACFGEPAKPLAIGINAELLAACPDIEHHALLYFLAEYTSSEAYHRAMIVGAARVDLTGQPGRLVTASDAGHAKSQLKTMGAA